MLNNKKMSYRNKFTVHCTKTKHEIYPLKVIFFSIFNFNIGDKFNKEIRTLKIRDDLIHLELLQIMMFPL